METKEFQTRMLIEFRQLVERRTTLENTVNSKSCVNIESKQMGLLRKQLEAMLQYEEILFTRIIDLMK
mgnify:CR=1 FL=1